MTAQPASTPGPADVADRAMSRAPSQLAPDASASGALGLPSATVEAIARRLAELLVAEFREPLRLLDTATVARMLFTSEGWVRDHAAELGGIRIGDGRKGALRFETRRVRAALEARRVNRPQERQQHQPGPRRRSLGVLPAAVPEDVRDW
jgi:hypothetical protein